MVAFHNGPAVKLQQSSAIRHEATLNRRVTGINIPAFFRFGLVRHPRQTVFTSETGGPYGQNDRRRFLRFQSNKQAAIKLRETLLCDCIIKDISETGAKLLVSQRNWIPRQFEITVLSRDLALPAKRVWRMGEKVGVEFVESNDNRNWTIEKLRGLLLGYDGYPPCNETSIHSI